MTELYSIGSALVIALPFVLGFLAFGAIWFRDEFWKEELYPEQKD